MKPVCVILAAGMGSRYGGLKQVEAVGPAGETLLEYSVYDALRAGFGEIVFVIRKDIEDVFGEKVISRFPATLPYRFAYQELDDVPKNLPQDIERQKPWGTGHAVRAARTVVASPFAVINADDFYGPLAFELLYTQLTDGEQDYILGGYQLQHTLSAHGSVSRGLCSVDADGYLQCVEELTKIFDGPGGPYAETTDGQRALSYDDIVSMNCWGFRPSFFNVLNDGFAAFIENLEAHAKAEYYLPVAVESAMNSGVARVKVISTGERWMGITYPQDKAEVIAQLRQRVVDGVYPEALWSASI